MPLATPGTDTDTLLGSRYRALTLAMVSVILLIAFEATAVGTAMPIAARELDGLPLYAFAFSGYFTTSLFAMVVSGQWCDRTGPLAPLITGIGAFAAGLVVSGTAQSMWPFVLGRAVQGVGGGLVIVALYVLVGLAYPERLRPSVMAAFAASWVLPSIVGPLVAGTVTEQFGWRWVFLAIPVLVVLPLLIGLPALRRTSLQRHADDRTAPDRRRLGLALAVSAGAGLLQYAGQDLRPLSLVFAAAGAALVVPAALGLLPRGTFRAARGLPSVVLLRGVASGTFLGAESFVPLMLVTQRHMSPTLAGLSLAGGGVTWGVGSWIQGRPRFEPHRERLVALGTLLMAAAIAGAALPLLDAAPSWSAAAAWAVGGLGAGLVISSLSVILFKLSPPSEAGANSAALQVSDALSSVVLVASAGTVFAALGGAKGAFTAIFIPLAALSLAGVGVAARLRQKAG
ncbi:MFS transporter [Streptomyces mangrovisoli]|uniref:MFS transporter n=1 Tax=Streptomyces mangrovisoli TaxID=1428628 RepID=A0A1J4P0K8_9ACTN|nr:MFS transporter [Streptomyces mangrovisoli]OIJ68279.1 MFS transporter [Streptomyces mangrovisoli]